MNASIESKMEELLAELKQLGSTVRHLEAQIRDLSWHLDRHQRRLECIEEHPPFPLQQPPRHYATETQSVSLAKRKRLGHLG